MNMRESLSLQKSNQDIIVLMFDFFLILIFILINEI
jgi:hypothetical protein